MAENRAVRGRFAADARIPLGHVARLGGVEPQAEAVTHFPVFGEHARHEYLLASGDAHRLHVNERDHETRKGFNPLRVTRP